MTQPDLFTPEARTVEVDLSGDDLLALRGNTAWRIVWLERRGNAGWKVKAERVTSTEPDFVTNVTNLKHRPEPEHAQARPKPRLPYADD